MKSQKVVLSTIERAAQQNQTKNMTLDQLSALVDSIGKEYRSKNSQLQPLITDLKVSSMHHAFVFDLHFTCILEHAP